MSTQKLICIWYLRVYLWYWATEAQIDVFINSLWISQLVRCLGQLPSCLRAPAFSSNAFQSGYLSLPVCLQPPLCSLEKWLMGLREAQACSCSCVYVCLSLSDCLPQCVHCNGTGLCNWNGNEPINGCSGFPPCPAFTSLFYLRQTPHVCDCLKACVLKMPGPSVFNPRAWRDGVKM